MFNATKYTRLYYTIIDAANRRPEIDFFETHHIIPESLGGDNSRKNLVRLTPREHYLCHRLLKRMVNDSEAKQKMAAALWCMTNGNGRQVRYQPNSRIYERLKKERSDFMSRKQQGKGNTFYGRKHTKESRQKMSDNNATKRPEVAAKISKSRLGIMPHNHGKPWDESVKKKISASLTGYKHSAETRAKHSLDRRNRIWVNNGIDKPRHINKNSLCEYTEQGWRRGRGPKKNW